MPPWSARDYWPGDGSNGGDLQRRQSPFRAVTTPHPIAE
jgi:hypothetical protein